MKKLNKWLALGVSVVTAAMLLTGCGKSGTAEANAPSAAESADAASAGSQTEKSTDSAPAGNDVEDVIVVKAVTTGSPAPYMTIDENSEAQGSDIDIIRAVFDRLPQYDLQITISADALTGLLSGQYQIGVNNYGWREERGESYYYSLPYKTGYDVFIQRIDDEPLTGLQDLADRGYKTEVGAGSLKASALEAWNQENPEHQIDIVYSEVDFQQKFQHIVDGVTDVAIDDGPILDTLITLFGLEDALVGNPIDEETQKFISPHNSSFFLFPKDEAGAALREAVDGVLLELKEDGTLAEILEGYFGKDTSPKIENMQETLN